MDPERADVTPPGPSSPAVVSPRRERPAALQVEARRVVLAGTIAFAVISVVLAACWPWLHAHGRLGWLAATLAATALGPVGLVLLGRHRRQGRTR